jgi:integrase
MPRQRKPPRLHPRPERRDKEGKLTHAATWIILDGGRYISTGLDASDIIGAQKALADYINRKHTESINKGPRSAESIPVADVLHLYLRDVVPTHANPKAAVRVFKRVAGFFADKYLSQVNGQLCREYAATRPAIYSARRDLEELRAAINYHHREGLHDSVIKVWLPTKARPRERWLTRSEVAKLVRAAYRFSEPYNRKRSKVHIARFILIAVYTGSRAGVIAQAALQKEIGRPYFDLDRGLFYRRPEGAAETRKRRPTIPVPPPLLAHLRRWKRMGARYAVEWLGRPIQRVDESFRFLVDEVGLEGQVIPHTLRHTCATWLMQNGTDPWKAAGFLGMTIATLERTYGHHHPNHMAGVHEAFQKHRTANVSPTIAVNRR